MRRLLGFLALALLSGAILFHVLTSQNGFVLISVGRYVVELSLWTALLLLVLVYVFFVMLRKLWQLLYLPGKWWQWRAGRRETRFRNRTEQGLLDYLEGNWAGALDNLSAAAPRAHNPQLNFLGAASASIHAGESGDAENLLQRAEKSGSGGAFAAHLLRARLMLQQSRHEEALILLRKLQQRQPGHPSVLRLLVDCHEARGDWSALEQLLPDLKKNRVFTTAELTALELQVWQRLLETFATESSTSDPADSEPSKQARTDSPTDLDRLWAQVPRRLQVCEALIAAYILQLHRLGQDDIAESKLRRHLNRHWSDRLVGIYGSLDSNSATQLTVAEAWLLDNPNNPVLLSTLGRLCARNQLWGKAREYYEKSLALTQQPELLYELGRLHRQLGDSEKSADCFERGLRLSVQFAALWHPESLPPACR